MSIQRKSYQVQGSNLSVLEAGNTDDPVALFLHGIPASAELFRGVIEQVSQQGWHCLAPDLPGYGQTQMAKGADYSVKGVARFMIQWLQQEGFSNIWLVAHDIGGGVAQLMLTENESLFAKATLSNCITADTWPVPFIQRLINVAKVGMFAPMARWGMFKANKLFDPLKKAFIHPEVLTQENFKRVFYDGKFHARGNRAEFQNLLKSLNPKDTLGNMDKLAQVQTPVHLVWAMKDPFQAWDKPGSILENTFANVKVSKIEDSGHFVPLDATEDYVKAILEK